MRKTNHSQPANNARKRASKLRIIAGEWRSRQLPIPNIAGLRPTPDRVRETLFNWIQHDILGAKCADLFCGSGALGLEALSRGAKSTHFVDDSSIVAQQMQINLATLNANDAYMIQQNAAEFLGSSDPQPLDIIFLDPPFRKHWLAQIVPLLEKGWLAKKALVYIEIEKEAMLPIFPPYWTLRKEKNAGQLAYRLFEVLQMDSSADAS